MTTDEIRQLSGAELDREVAKALGGTYLQQAILSSWSTDPEHAVRLLIEAEKRGWRVEIYLQPSVIRWEVTIQRRIAGTAYDGYGTLSEAIARAFVLASVEDRK